MELFFLLSTIRILDASLLNALSPLLFGDPSFGTVPMIARVRQGISGYIFRQQDGDSWANTSGPLAANSNTLSNTAQDFSAD